MLAIWKIKLVALKKNRGEGMKDSQGLTYAQAGVDISAGNRAVELIKDHVKKTNRPEVIGGIGGFAGLFQLDLAKYRQPVLVSCTDGVGTKLKLAFLMDKHDTIGQDLVAMCVNDMIVQGAEPLFFLDYLAVGKLIPEKIERIVSGIAEACVLSGCSLVGGETAELPGFYQEGEYDLAGFAVGIVERDKMIDGSQIKPGDRLIGLASSGVHSNGYSLVRKVLLETAGYSLEDKPSQLGCSLGEELLKPTRIYVRSVLSLIEQGYGLKGAAHITGGGLLENVPRVLPEGNKAVIEKQSWPIPPIFSLIQSAGNVEEKEMFRTFNMGIGMVLVVPEEEEASVLTALQNLGEQAYPIGTIVAGDRGVEFR
jgi:phosphoribosylformylglycinamidine cyclo-ligase